jgi:hypothetical protein
MAVKRPSNRASRVNALLGVLTHAAAKPGAPVEAGPPPSGSADTGDVMTSPRRDVPNREPGKPALIYLHLEDRQLIRELAAFLASQGLRVNDSLVIKTALRAARPGPLFLEAYRAAARTDRRFKARPPGDEQ